MYWAVISAIPESRGLENKNFPAGKFSVVNKPDVFSGIHASVCLFYLALFSLFAYEIPCIRICHDLSHSAFQFSSFMSES